MSGNFPLPEEKHPGARGFYAGTHRNFKASNILSVGVLPKIVLQVPTYYEKLLRCLYLFMSVIVNIRKFTQ